MFIWWIFFCFFFYIKISKSCFTKTRLLKQLMQSSVWLAAAQSLRTGLNFQFGYSFYCSETRVLFFSFAIPIYSDREWNARHQGRWKMAFSFQLETWSIISVDQLLLFRWVNRSFSFTLAAYFYKWLRIDAPTRILGILHRSSMHRFILFHPFVFAYFLLTYFSSLKFLENSNFVLTRASSSYLFSFDCWIFSLAMQSQYATVGS